MFRFRRNIQTFSLVVLLSFFSFLKFINQHNTKQKNKQTKTQFFLFTQNQKSSFDPFLGCQARYRWVGVVCVGKVCYNLTTVTRRPSLRWTRVIKDYRRRVFTLHRDCRDGLVHPGDQYDGNPFVALRLSMSTKRHVEVSSKTTFWSLYV